MPDSYTSVYQLSAQKETMTIESNTPARFFKFHFTCYVMTKLAILTDKKKLQLTLIISQLMLKTEREMGDRDMLMVTQRNVSFGRTY